MKNYFKIYFVICLLFLGCSKKGSETNLQTQTNPDESKNTPKSVKAEQYSAILDEITRLELNNETQSDAYINLSEWRMKFLNNPFINDERFNLAATLREEYNNNKLAQNEVQLAEDVSYSDDVYNSDVRASAVSFYEGIFTNPDGQNSYVTAMLASMVQANLLTERDSRTANSIISLNTDITFDENGLPIQDPTPIKYRPADKQFLLNQIPKLSSFFGSLHQNYFNYLGDETILYLQSQGIFIQNMQSLQAHLNFQSPTPKFNRVDYEIMKTSQSTAENIFTAYTNGIREFAIMEIDISGQHQQLSFLLGSKLFQHDLAQFGLQIKFINWETPLPSILENGGCLLHSISFNLNHVSIEPITLP